MQSSSKVMDIDILQYIAIKPINKNVSNYLVSVSVCISCVSWLLTFNIKLGIDCWVYCMKHHQSAPTSNQLRCMLATSRPRWSHCPANSPHRCRHQWNLAACDHSSSKITNLYAYKKMSPLCRVPMGSLSCLCQEPQ